MTKNTTLPLNSGLASGVHKQLDCNILIIDDQPSIATAIANMLQEKWGCNVTVANSYQQTEEILSTRAQDFFMAISDLNLPEAANGEVIDLLIAHKQAVITITGYFNQSLHITLSEKGVIDYVLKNNTYANNAYEYLVNLVGRLYANKFTKVLIVDDSEYIQKITGAYLERQFLNVCYAKNGAEGLAMLETFPDIKLVLVDSEMPVMDGLTFTASARKIKPQNNLCIIGISSSTQKDLSSQFLKQGANDYISKPYSYDEITCRVNQNLNMLEYIEELNRIANYDHLTQLPNRHQFVKRGADLVANAKAQKKHTVLAILDIDFFKRINDTYGHECGDEALVHLAKIIKDVLGQHIIARLGGEEFGFIIQVANFSISSALLESLRLKIAESAFIYNGQEVSFTASIGATYEMKEDLKSTMKIADNYLYLAKAAGRNRIVWNHNQPIVAESR